MSEIKVNSIKGVGATAAAITVNNSDGTCTANITNNLSNRNLVINGAMNIAQRGTSSTSAGYATVDRFRLAVANADQAAFTQKQVSDSPDDFSQSYEFDVTTAETSLDSNEYAFIGHRVEAQNLQRVKANQVTLSFYVKAYQTGTYAINIYQQDGNIQITKTYTVSQSGTWEKKTLTFAANTGTQPNNDNGFGWEIGWVMAAGSGVTSSDSTSWGTYSDAGFAFGQGVNVLSSTDNYFKITGIQLEVGSVATDFEHRSIGQELALCQRYYWKIAQNTYRRVNGYKRADANSFWEVKCPVPMRTAPSPTLITSGTFTNFNTNFNTTQSSPVVNEWNTDTGMGLLHVQSNWSTTSASIPSWEGYEIEFSSEL
tara:strand:+ start:658 stop:1767 length:1110 start_codon:yes stop_codon:yes gene_type:complete